jgi:hypothetical protein
MIELGYQMDRFIFSFTADAKGCGNKAGATTCWGVGNQIGGTGKQVQGLPSGDGQPIGSHWDYPSRNSILLQQC